MKQANTALVDVDLSLSLARDLVINGNVYYKGFSGGEEYLVQIPLFVGLQVATETTIRQLDANTDHFKYGMLIMVGGERLINHLGIDFVEPELLIGKAA